MEHLFSRLRKTLATRLSQWIILFASIILLLALGYMFSVSRKAIRQEAINTATQNLESTALRVQQLLDRVVVAADNTDWLVTRHLDAPDSMFVYSQRILKNNPDLNGCSIAFEPYYFKEKGLYFSAYSYNDHGNIETIQEGNNHYEYFYMDWYQLCKLLDQPVWTEPFMDYNPEGIYSKEMIASYCKPIKDQDGTYIGTFSTDLSLGWLAETISAVKPYPNSYSIMIGRGGTYFVHPDTTKLFYQTIFTETMERPDTAVTGLGRAMLRGEEGMRQLNFDGQDCFVFYKPLGDTGWSTAIVCPESDIFANFNKLRRSVVATVLLGLLLMMLIVGRIIFQELTPLKQLASQAETISQGNFNAPLAKSDRTDEIGQLNQSFSNMQQSLVNYIEELKKTTALKASMESELKVASDIQMSMVPRIFPAFPNRKDIDLFASMTPAKEVGGDLYDFFVQDERLYFCVGDVSGKGIPASLFMAVTRNLFRIFSQQGHSAVEIAEEINTFLSTDNDQGMFVTMFVGVVDLKSGRLDWCNCGHNPPLLDGKFLEMQYVNQPLGIWDGGAFQGESLADFRGRQLLVYTDGLNEAENFQKELFGNERLEALMATLKDRSSKEVILSLQDAVEHHRDGASPNDDLTLFCLRVLDQKV